MAIISSDEELVRKCLAGEEDAFARLYDRYRHSVFSTVFRIIQDLEESQDATQEIFIKVYRSLADWDPGRAKFSTWLYRLAANHAIDCWRVRRRNSKVVDQPGDKGMLERCHPDPRRSPFCELEGKERRKEIKRCIDTLPELQKKIFILRYLRGLKLEEIAHLEERSLGTIKASLFRATQAVRRRLLDSEMLGATVLRYAG